MALTPFGSGFGSLWDPLSSFCARSVWDPFDFMDSVPAEVRSFARDAHAVAGTRVDWVENEDAHVFKADLPGLRKEDVKVELQDDRVLQISGERSKEEEKKTDTWHRVERSHGRFLRQFKLPNNVKANEVSAKVENGVLTVTVPKAPKPEPQSRSIDIA